MKHSYTAKTVLPVLFFVLFSLFPGSSKAQENFGTDFWYTMPRGNPLATGAAPINPYKLVVIGYYDCTVTVNYPRKGVTLTAAVTGGIRTVISLPVAHADVITTPETIQGNGFHVTSTKPVAVYAVYYESATAEITPVFPTYKLGTEYYTVAYRENTDYSNEFQAKVSIATTQPNTTVTFKLPTTAWTSKGVDVADNVGLLTPQSYPPTHYPNTSWSVTLPNAGETYTIICNDNYTYYDINPNLPTNRQDNVNRFRAAAPAGYVPNNNKEDPY